MLGKRHWGGMAFGGVPCFAGTWAGWRGRALSLSSTFFRLSSQAKDGHGGRLGGDSGDISPVSLLSFLKDMPMYTILLLERRKYVCLLYYTLCLCPVYVEGVCSDQAMPGQQAPLPYYCPKPRKEKKRWAGGQGLGSGRGRLVAGMAWRLREADRIESQPGMVRGVGEQLPAICL